MSSRFFSKRVSAFATAIFVLVSRDARAEYVEKLPSSYPSLTTEGCLVPVTRMRILDLPQPEQDRWIAWSFAQYPGLKARYQVYANAARSYYASLEPAARKFFPATEFSRVEVLSSAPLVVAKVVADPRSTWTFPKGATGWTDFCRALLPKLGYASTLLEPNRNEQRPFANGAICIGCRIDAQVDPATQRVLEVWSGLGHPSPELNRVPKTTSDQAAAALTALHPPYKPLTSIYAKPTLAVMRDARGKGRLVWASYFREHCFPGDTFGANIGYAVDVDSLAIVGTIRASDLRAAIDAAQPPSDDRT